MKNYIAPASFFLFSTLFLVLWLVITGHDGSFYSENMMDGGSIYLPVDSNFYLRTSIEELQPIISLGMGTNYLPVLIGDFAEWLTPETPYLVVYAINLFILNMAFWAFLSIVKTLGSKALMSAFVFWLLSPILFFIVTGINKEILSLASIALFLCFVLKFLKTRKNIYLFGIFIILVLSLFIRNMLFIAELGLLLYLYIKPRHPLFLLLFLTSLLLPIAIYITNGFLFGEGFYSFFEVASIKSMQTAKLFELSTQLYAYPLGFFISYFINGTIYIMAPVLNPSYWRGIWEHFNPSEVFLMLSSFYMSIMLVTLFIKGKVLDRSVVHVFMYGYSILIFLLPISQHRYLIPIYPVLFILFFLKKGKF